MINGRRMAYDEVSPSQPKGTVLLLTGADSNRLTWYKQLDVFGRAFRTIAVDYRDTGDSDSMSEPYTIVDLATDAVFVLDALGVQRAHVVGYGNAGEDMVDGQESLLCHRVRFDLWARAAQRLIGQSLST